MSAPKGRCPECRELKSECLCPSLDDEEPSAGECRDCGVLVERGPRGWRDPEDQHTDGYGCAESPSGWHERR